MARRRCRRCDVRPPSDYISVMSFEDSHLEGLAQHRRRGIRPRGGNAADHLQAGCDRSPGRTYDYLKVPPEVVDEFLDAESHGQFVNWRIKPNYDCREVRAVGEYKIPLEILKDMNGQDKHGHDR